MPFKVEFTQTVKFGDAVIDEIVIHGLAFVVLTGMWTVMAGAKKPVAVLQRERIKKQVHFMSGGKRIFPDAAQIGQLPAAVARNIISNLEVDQGPAGKVIHEGDGMSTPILYQLGTPIEMKDSKGVSTSIKELEFIATTYAELEDVLCGENDMVQALELLKTVAAPVGVSGLMRLPGWALDKVTVADGVSIMQKVLPSF